MKLFIPTELFKISFSFCFRTSEYSYTVFPIVFNVMTVDVVFIFQCGLAVSLALASQSYLDSQQFFSKWLIVALSFMLALSGVSLTAYNYSLSVALSCSPAMLLVSSVSIIAGLAAHLLKATFWLTLSVVAVVLVTTTAAVYWSFWDVHPELAKFVLSVLLFSSVAFYQRRRDDYFLADLSRAALMSLLLFPAVLIFAGVFFLVFAAVADAIGLPRSMVNPVVFYGIFHCPNVILLVLFMRYQSVRPLLIGESIV
jgi:hypothetical protein